MKKLTISLLFALYFLIPFIALAQDTYLHLDVPYVPTPESVVDTMLDIAKVNKNDILYDLGCGDGRIVITAAKNKGARGIGIDINPKRIQESIANAEKANVADKVQFIEQDLFITDFSEATVVTLYLLPDVNLKLRPRLLRELKPGTRIVSHDFSMGTWEPDQILDIPDDYRSHTVYYWIIPANITGRWEWNLVIKKENIHYVMEVNQQFQHINGIVSVGSLKIPIEDITLEGDRLQFILEQNVRGDLVVMDFDGQVNGNSLLGSVKSQYSSITDNQQWKVTRDPSTITPLDIENTEIR